MLSSSEGCKQPWEEKIVSSSGAKGRDVCCLVQWIKYLSQDLKAKMTYPFSTTQVHSTMIPLL
jgi:hypothetical protein